MLPLFGSEDGDTVFLNSGGRGAILEAGGRLYKIKGVDPKGVITKRVAGSSKNRIPAVEDISLALCFPAIMTLKR